MRLLLVVLIAACLGCSHFIVREGDGGWTKTRKITGRVFGGLLTMGFSELHIERQKQRERFRAYLQTLTPEEQKAILGQIYLQQFRRPVVVQPRPVYRPPPRRTYTPPPPVIQQPSQTYTPLPPLAPVPMPVLQLCPDGTYVSGTRCILAPDGTYVGG